MTDIRETVIDHVDGENFATVSTAERKWIRLVHKLSEQRPGEVDIRAVNEDGSLVARVPYAWMKLSPPRQIHISEERREELRERLAAARKMAGSRSAKTDDGGKP